MKSKKTLVLFVLLVSVHFSFSQNFAFKVLVNKGKNEIKKGASWQPLKVGSVLAKTDEIRLVDDAYLGLVHHSGKAVEIKKPGPHKVSVLEESIPQGKSVMVKYTDFILSSNSDQKTTLNATGAVSRGPENIQVFLPTSPSYTVVYGENVIITWDKQDMKGPFTVTFSNPFGDDLKAVESQTNSVAIDLSDRDFQYEDNILIKIVSKTDRKESPDQLMIKRLSKADKERVKKQLDELWTSTEEETALNKLILAGFFESQNLLIDASTAYQQAIELAPNVPEYEEYYLNFITRTGIKTK
jgi:hypothetical protein